MALKVGELFAALSLTKDKFSKGLDSAHSDAKSWTGKVGGVFKTAGKLIAVGLGIALVAIAAVGKEAAGNAVEQERATARVKATYKAQGDAVTEWAQKSSKVFGVNDDVLEVSMSKYGDWAKNVGMSTREAIGGGQAMAQRAAEISLATGKSFEEVFNGLFKGQQGMSRGLKEYGITVDKAALMSEAVRMGLIKEGEAMDAATAARARGSLIMQQSTQFTEVAAGMQDSMALKTRQMGATMDEIMDTIGVVFLNLAEAILPHLATAFQALADWVVGNMPTIQAFIETAVQVIGFVLGLLGEYFNFLSKNVFPIFQSALGGVGEGTSALADVFDWVRANILPPLQSIFNTFSTVILPALREAFAGVQQWIKDNWPLISKVIGQVANAIKGAFDVIAEVIRIVAPIIVEIGRVVFPLVGAAAKNLLQTVSRAFEGLQLVWTTAQKVAATVTEAIGRAFDNLKLGIKVVWDGITSIIKGAINIVISVINGFIRAINRIQIHIPRIGVGDVAVGPFDWNGLNLGTIPMLAKGLWKVPGPMLAGLHAGEMVVPAAAASRIREDRLGFGDDRGGGGNAPFIGEQHIHGVLPGDVERETRRALRRETMSWGLT